jgi:hypothetical protein
MSASPAPAADQGNGYPTVAVADYVFACMASNGQSRPVLEQCSCSIDVLASILPYERYVEAETIMRMRFLGGEKGSIFRSDAAMKTAVGDLRRAQAEAEIRCF